MTSWHGWRKKLLIVRGGNSNCSRVLVAFSQFSPLPSSQTLSDHPKPASDYQASDYHLKTGQRE